MTDPYSDPDVGLVEGERIAQAIEDLSPTLSDEVSRHREQHGEVLPTLLLDRLADWYLEAHDGKDSSRLDADRLTELLAALWGSKDEVIQTAIATGFLEALPGPDDPDRAAVDSLPTVLREELRAMEEWRPT